MAAITSVFTLAAVARQLGVSEDLLHELTVEMEPEDGRLTVYGPDDEETPAFTRDGVERLREFLDIHRQIDLPLDSP